ncbi:MAG: AAA ATPase [Candidatus Nomurabacteria bacterium GW2011_GWE1_32_28]|uniref:AAA ATPase n=1 Tax=Candidatus Nomurabacteria bacterium GW2011_GWF1_31_48 TaxID=1618767 RepID=A0A0F9YUJ6_9BACT|nr:MAG: AAA ATPase [Candidatus Nomurabacteria bacterium GW2011_GWF2_30_133]KKP28516.1 MAG: AAA ATPase [Candidatus Nomurabacteria bacterium GW2011_GWE2_31_40]KKP30111.1 MAG: AAA ATPase [Candidatus Nomurabacteria bacterium GW2011_GWF1_31_48]KKP34656.1 MAG: AAA ATPase [Candidatus Nomurabacteria bacterium GW2011_GWE1_32_28]HAS80883.1 hypothetical protein [Candidatus Nomurabacteria bacterium]
MPIPEQMGIILKRWQERLIDVSKSNPLLGLNRSRTAKLEINSPDLSNLTKTLLTDSSILKLPFVQKKPKRIISTDEETPVENEEYIFHEGDLDFIYSSLSDLRKKMRKLFDNSQLTMNERGVNTLYLAMGCLEWEDVLMGKSESPLIMVPCNLEFKGSSKPMNLIMSDEDVIINPAIRFYLKEREEINIPEIPEDFDFDKVDDYLKSIEDQVKANGWKVTKRAWLGIFSFETLAIYQDLKLLDSQARNNTLVQAIAHLNSEAIENIGLDDKLDELQTPQIVPVPVVKADSSQLRAITMASQNANLVIHGPPGTGKSQTITSIIANALGQKKKVLFVSAKMAALNVVHNRLQSIGLGQYCLEAHGVKSGKRKVIDELKRTLEIYDDIKIANNIDEDINKLVESRNSLNEYVKSLHDSQNSLSISLFNAYGKFEKLNNIPLINKAPLPWVDIGNVSFKELEQTVDVLREVSDNAELFLGRDNHPLRGMKSEGVDLNTLENLGMYLNKIITFCEVVQEEIIKTNFFKNIDLSIPDLFTSTQIFKLLTKINDLPTDWNKKSVEELEIRLNEVIECVDVLQKRNKYKDEFYSLTSQSPQEILDIINKYKETYPDWYSKLSLRFFKDRKKCKGVLDKITNVTSGHLEEAITKAQQLISSEDDLVLKLEKIPSNILNAQTVTFESILYIQQQYESVVAIKRWEQNTNTQFVKNPVFDKKISNNFAGLVDTLDSNKKEIEDIQKIISEYWPEGFMGQIKIENNSLDDVQNSVQTIQDNLNQSEVRDWQIISRILNHCANHSLLPFLHKLDSKTISNAPEVFEKRFYSLWISFIIHSKPILSEFSGDSQRNLINKFKILDEKVMRLTAINTIAEPAKIARQVKTANTMGGNSNGVGILRKEMEKKKRLKPLRVLFNEIPQVLQALKPCFLMSPLSVSTFLKPGAFNFDIVIFDEASQLPTPEAIPSILRAKQVIVAGDSNQLPPTSFFRTNITNDSDEWDDQQVEELESLLNDCKASVPFFQETDLRWHYRSRDERLINFSNHYYYENNLITFPSPINTDDKKTGVILEYVPDGIWDRGGSRVNRKEARHVAKLIIKHFKSEPEKSLGVVSLNSSQKEAIEDALEEELQSHKELLPFLDSENNDAFFVKSLENVQGDERDVIIISVGYAKAQDGKMTLNFGPINTEGGWRRLNVLVTRAKWKTVLVTSVRSSELGGINPENKGAVGLKNYIQYAETGYLNEAKDPARLLGEETNDFEDSVQRELELRGFKVDPQVGVGSFKIDLAVRDPKNPTGYAIGIECDGASYHSSRSARDRDILRQEILEGMGWKLHRVWSTDWFRNREMTTNILIESVNRAINNHASKNVQIKEDKNKHDDDIGDELISVPIIQKRAGVPYQKTKTRCNRKMVMETNKVYELAGVISSIVEDEGPIINDMLLDRIRELTKVGRVGSNIQNNFDRAIKIAISNKEIEKSKSKKDKCFLFNPNKKYTNFRTPGDGVERQLNQISSIEIKNAIKYLIKNQFGLAYDNMIQSLKPLFGINRVDPEESDRVKDLVDEMIEKGTVTKQGPLLNLAVVDIK